MNLAGRRVAVYARFSSDRQRDSSIEDQVARCRRWIEERGGVLAQALVFADFAISAASMDRPGWTALEARIAARAVDVVVVESLDRVSRKVGDTAHLVERLRFAGVALVGIADAVDTSAPSALLHTTLRGLVAESYLADLADKTRRGMEGRARAGGPTGGLPYGYRSGTDAAGQRTVEIHPEHAEVVRRIFDSYAGAASYASIAAELNREGIPAPRSSRRDRSTPNTWALTTVRAIVANEAYAGRWIWNRRVWVKVPGTNRRVSRERPRAEWIVSDRPDLAIVDAATWARCNARTTAQAEATGGRSTAERRARGTRSYLLSGLLRCGACDSLMMITGGAEGRRYYQCRAAAARGTCTESSRILEHETREAFLGSLRSVLTSPEVVAEVIAIVTEEIERRAGGAGRLEHARREVARIEGQIERLVDALAGGGSAAIAGRVRDLERDLAAARSALVTASAERPRLDPAALAAELVDVLATAEGPDVPAGREALRRALGPRGIVATRSGRSMILRAIALPPSLVGARGRELAGIAGAGFVGCLTPAAEVRIAAAA